MKDAEVEESESIIDDPRDDAVLKHFARALEGVLEAVERAAVGNDGQIAAGVAISMDGRGRWMDNVLIERLWRSLKYEDVYLKGMSTVAMPSATSLLGSPFTMNSVLIRR